MRWASRMGRSERVKLADSKRVSAVRGGWPCLVRVSDRSIFIDISHVEKDTGQGLIKSEHATVLWTGELLDHCRYRPLLEGRTMGGYLSLLLAAVLFV